MTRMLLLFGICVFLRVTSGAEDVAYIQIFDFVNQTKTSPMDPALVLTEVKEPSDIFSVSYFVVFSYQLNSYACISIGSYHIEF